MPIVKVKIAGIDGAESAAYASVYKPAEFVATHGVRPASLEISGANFMYEGARVKSWMVGGLLDSYKYWTEIFTMDCLRGELDITYSHTYQSTVPRGCRCY